MTQRMNEKHFFFFPWPLLAMGIVGVIALILMLPLILGTVAMIGIFSGYLIWRVNKFFRRIEADHMWKDDSERNQYSDQPVIDIFPTSKDIYQ